MNRDRIIEINAPKTSDKVLYIMYNAFRVNDNHSLIHAKESAVNRNNLTIFLHHIVEDNPRNNEFIFKGIANYKEVLSNHCADSFFYSNQEVLESIHDYDLIIMDMPYLKELAMVTDSGKNI